MKTRLLITEDEKKHIMKLYGLTKNSLVNEQIFSLKTPDTSSKNRKLGDTPFKNKEEGDKFRKWVNDTFPEIARGLDLDPAGEYNNAYIQWAWNLPIETNAGTKETLGQRYKNYGYGYDKKTETSTTSKSICPVIDENSNIQGLQEILNSAVSSRSPIKTYTSLNNIINMFAQRFANQGIPVRTACQAALNKVRPNFKDKNQIIMDSLNKLIYVFDKDGNFIAKDVIITGAHKQSKDLEIIAKSLVDWDGACNREGFFWDENKGEYIDKTGKNRKYNPDIIYNSINKNGTRFLPAGIFTTARELGSGEEYYGGKDNELPLSTMDGKEILQWMHGYYVEPPRTEAINAAKRFLSKSNDPKVSQEFLDEVGIGNINLSHSYGCINLTPDFIPILRKNMVNSYLFNVSEDKQNYLVQNSQKFFDKTLNQPSCPNPNSFGAEIPIDFTG